MDEQKQQFLVKSLQRVFALPITKSTFRDVQNSILAVTEGDKDKAQQLLEDLVNDKMDVSPDTKHDFSHFSYLILVAKDVFEKGDFVGLVTSDTVGRDDQIFFSNRIRRIDGTELHFVSDINSTIQIMNHFLNKLSEIKNYQNSKEVIEEIYDKLTFLEEGIKALKS